MSETEILFGENYTPQYASSGIIKSIEERALKSNYLDDDGKLPMENVNHRFWKNNLQGMIEVFRKANKSGTLRNMLPTPTDILAKYESIVIEANTGTMSFRDAYTTIMVMDAQRNAYMKEEINHNYAKKIRARNEYPPEVPKID